MFHQSLIILVILMDTKRTIGKDIIEAYQKYRRKETFKKTVREGISFDLPKQYQVQDIIGKGAYGCVVSAINKKPKKNQFKMVAIKRIDKPFEHKIESRKILREMKIMKHMKNQNLLGLETIILPPSREDFNEIYLVMRLLDSDLSTIIKSKQALEEAHYKFFIYQLCRGLKYFHSLQLTHRDLKPKNLLVTEDCELVIADYGLARPITSKTKLDKLTTYVVTRWYRAPELFLDPKAYNSSVDMWSVGCIMAELLTGKTLFRGRDQLNQIELIFKFLGSPSTAELKAINQDIQLPSTFASFKPKKFAEQFSKAKPDAVDLLQKLLVFNPAKRLTAEEALKHPYLADYHQPDDEPVGPQMESCEFEFEEHELTNEQLKDIIYQQILLYHYEDFRVKYDEMKKKQKSVIKHILNNSNATNIDPVADADEETDQQSK